MLHIKMYIINDENNTNINYAIKYKYPKELCCYLGLDPDKKYYKCTLIQMFKKNDIYGRIMLDSEFLEINNLYNENKLYRQGCISKYYISRILTDLKINPDIESNNLLSFYDEGDKVHTLEI